MNDYSQIGRMFTPSVSQRFSGPESQTATQLASRNQLIMETKTNVHASNDLDSLVLRQKKT